MTGTPSQGALDLRNENMRNLNLIIPLPRADAFQQQAHVIKQAVAVGPSGKMFGQDAVLIGQSSEGLRKPRRDELKRNLGLMK